MPSATSVFGLASMQVQFFSLLSKLSLPWPDEFRTVLYWVNLCNLDPRPLLRDYDLPVVDFRLLFLIVANGLPLFIALMMLILFQPLSVVLWYFLTAGSFVALLIGLVWNFIENQDLGVWFAAGGGFLLVICAIVGVTAYCLRTMDRDDEDIQDELKKKRSMKLSFNPLRSLMAFLIAAGGFFGGCVLTGLVFDLSFSNREDSTLKIVGFVLFAVAGVALLHFLLHLPAAGRRLTLRISEFFERNLLMIMMLILSTSYVPAVTYCLNNFLCATYECPLGTKFNPFANRSTDSYETDAGLFCDPCYFRDDRCRIGGSQPQDPDALCPAWRGRQIWTHPETPCTDEGSTYFLISAALVLPTYLLLVPLMYIRLIRKVTSVIDGEAKLIPRGAHENVDFLPPVEAYERKISAVEPAASSLYAPYRMQYRYFELPMLLYRVVVVVVTAVITPFLPQEVVYILLGVHVLATLLLIFFQPFADKVEFYLSVALEGCDVLNCVYALLLLYGVDLPGWVAYVVVGLNVVVPAALTIATMKFIGDSEERAEKQMRKEHEAKMRRRAELSKQNADDDTQLNLLNATDHNDEDLLRLPRASSPLGASKAAAVDVPQGRAFSQWEKKQALEHNATLAQALNQKTAAMVTKWFMIIGFIFILALGSSLLGYAKTPRSSFVDGSAQLQRSYPYVLGGYESWQNFTNGCCCISTDNPPLQYALEERWVCGNGITVDRGRIGVDSSNNGLPVRSFCSRIFAVDATVYLNGTEVGIRYWNYTQLSVNGVSDFAKEYLW